MKVLKSVVKMVKKTQEEMKEIISRIDTGLLEKVSECDIVIEAAIEKMDVKKAL